MGRRKDDKNVDKIGRDEIVERMCFVVENLKKGEHCTIAFNGDWGSGKTFVLNLIEKKLNKTPKKYLIIKYDAWANTFYDDPLIAMLCCIIDGTEKKLRFVERTQRQKKEVIKEVADKILDHSPLKKIKNAIIAIKEILQSFSKKITNPRIEDFKSYETLLKETKEQLNAITEIKGKRGNPIKLVILVDEIDRCLPDEQLKILERVHHLFDVRNCVVICALNKKCIAVNFETTYGGDGEEYLRKFFNYTFNLKMKSVEYLQGLLKNDLAKSLSAITHINNKAMPERIFLFISSALDKNHMEIDNRSIQRYYSNFMSIINDFLGWNNINEEYLFLVAIALFIKQFIQMSFLENERTEKGFDYIRQYLKISKEINEDTFTQKDMYYWDRFNQYSWRMESGQPWEEKESKHNRQLFGKLMEIKKLILTYGGQRENIPKIETIHD